jgi:hypothetical protein
MLSAFDSSVLILLVFRRDMQYMIRFMGISVKSASAQNKSGWHQVANGAYWELFRSYLRGRNMTLNNHRFKCRTQTHTHIHLPHTNTNTHTPHTHTHTTHKHKHTHPTHTPQAHTHTHPTQTHPTHTHTHTPYFFFKYAEPEETLHSYNCSYTARSKANSRSLTHIYLRQYSNGD